MGAKRIFIIILSMMLVVNNSVGCGNTKNSESTSQSGITNDITSQEVESGNDEKTEDIESYSSSETVISTEYKPIEYRKNALIVQKSEDIELYGLLDDSGNIILEPKYDSLKFTYMNGQNYLKAKLMDDFGILNLDGTECVEMGKYEEIVSAGDIGWLAKQSDKQFLLDKTGEVTKELAGKYSKCIGNRYLLRVEIEAYVDGKRVEIETMEDGSDFQDMKYFRGSIYDLSEKMIISSKKYSYFMWLVNGDKIATFINNSKAKSAIDGKMVLINTSGEIIANLWDSPNIHFVNAIKEDNKIVWKVGRSVMEYDLASKQSIETQYSSDEEWKAQIHIEKTGEFYQCYKGDKLLFDERFAACRLDDGVIWLENTDSQYGIFDYDGKEIIPFGEIDFKNFDAGRLISDGMFGFYTEENSIYVFKNYVVSRGR